jgi:hypothetical protein
MLITTDKLAKQPSPERTVLSASFHPKSRLRCNYWIILPFNLQMTPCIVIALGYFHGLFCIVYCIVRYTAFALSKEEPRTISFTS